MSPHAFSWPHILGYIAFAVLVWTLFYVTALSAAGWWGWIRGVYEAIRRRLRGR